MRASNERKPLPSDKHVQPFAITAKLSFKEEEEKVTMEPLMTGRSSRTRLQAPFAIAAALAACSATSSNNPPPSADVRIVTNAATKGFEAFSPDTFTPRRSLGAKVTWRNDDRTTHELYVPGVFDQTLAPGDTASIYFTSGSRIGYQCKLHPGMQGVIHRLAP